MKFEKIHLSDHFTFKKILRFTISPILMMILTSIYWIVDGFFISNHIGLNAFAGVNLIFPVIMIVACVGFMFGTGGAALVSKRLGEKKKDEANKTFSLIAYTTFGVGIALSIIFFFLIRPISEGFAKINSVEASREMIDIATLYGQIMIGGVSLYIMQSFFHTFFSVNEKNFHGFLFTLAAGLTNMFLDYLLIGVFKLGVVGAASASLSGMFIGSVGPLLYFTFGRKNLIKLGKTRLVLQDIWKSITNGCSEFIGNVSSSVVVMVYNVQLLKYIGEDGVSAYGVIGYVCFVFFAIFIGYSVGIAPIVGYNYGAKNKEELTNVLNKSLIFVGITGIIMFFISQCLAGQICSIFTSSSPQLHALSVRAMKFYSICYLFAGFSIFGSAFFTALNNGILSAIISICRTMIFQVAFVFIFPLFIGVDGIWISIVIAELLSMILTGIVAFTNRKKYGYKFLFEIKHT